MTSDELSTLEEQLSSPRRIALSRIDHAEKRSGGLPALLISLLSTANHNIDGGQNSNTSTNNNNTTVDTVQKFCNQECTQTLFRTISLLSNVSQVDNTLGEEIARAGCQAILKRVIDRIKEYITICEAAPPTCTTTMTTYSIEELLDKLMDYLDVACELYSPVQSKGMPFTNEEIESRLPLVYNLGPSTDAGDNNNQSTILISQVTARQSSQGDVGYVMWPSAIVLSRWLLSNPQHILGKSILEIGAGCGLVGIAAARLISQSTNSTQQKMLVTITDVNDLVIGNIAKNIELNDVKEVASVEKLDFYEQTGQNESGNWLEGVSSEYRDPVDVVLAADIICQESDAVAAAKTIYDALVPNGRCFVVCADSDHRFGIEIFQEECEKIGLTVTTTNVADMSTDLLSDCHSTSGYIDGMNLTFYDIQKSEMQS
jgi:predicted nicotinamide N-methyase